VRALTLGVVARLGHGLVRPEIVSRGGVVLPTLHVESPSMRKVAIGFAVVAVAGLLGFSVHRHRRAEEQRAAEIRVCLTWPSQDQASCELHVEAGSLEIALQVAAHTHLLALRADVASARQRCTELDAAIGYVALGERVRHGTSTQEEQRSRRRGPTRTRRIDRVTDPAPRTGASTTAPRADPVAGISSTLIG
jgi:hypothetical protein